MSRMRLALAVVVLLLGVGGGTAIALGQRASREEHARQVAQEALEKAWQAIADQLAEAAKAQGTRAAELAKIDGVNKLVQETTSQNVGEIGNTFADLYQDVRQEDDKEVRSWFYRALHGSEVELFIGQNAIWQSAPVPDEFRHVVGTIKGDEPASELFVREGRLVAVGAARTKERTRNQDSATFVLFAPVPLEAFTVPPSGALRFTREGQSIELGEPARLTTLRDFRSTPGASELPCCVTRELGPASLAVFVDPAPRQAELKAAMRRSMATLVPMGGVLGLLVAALLFVLGRRNTKAEEARDQLFRETQAQLRQSQEALQRLSTGAFATQAAAGAEPKPELDLALASTQASVAASRYEVIAPLGEGGMARVYVAIVRGAEGFKRTFVLKRLKVEHAGNQELVNQFIDEARLGASLVHSNIVPILDFGRDAEGYFLTQEYILGRDVDSLIEASVTKRGRPLEPGLVAAIGQEALKALGYAHTRTDDSGKFAGLVHRDVSPANLMVSRRGEVKLLDFGIVKSADRVTQTQAGMVKGNLFYMSPEQARALPVDPRSDLFSLGMVLATAVLGRPLYSGNTMFELMNRAAAGPTPADLELVAKGAGPLAVFLQKALSVDPAQRCANAVEMAAELAVALPAAPSSQLEALVNELFGPEFDAERQRFSGAA